MTSAEFDRNSFEPDAKLIESYAIKFRWDSEKLRAVFRRFGALTEEAQKKLGDRLVEAFGSFQLLGEKVRPIPPAATAKRFRAVESNSRKILATLGINVKCVNWLLFDDPNFASGSPSRRLDQVYETQRPGAARANGRESVFPLMIARAHWPASTIQRRETQSILRHNGTARESQARSWGSFGFTGNPRSRKTGSNSTIKKAEGAEQTRSLRRDA